MSGWNATSRPSIADSGAMMLESTDPKLMPPCEASTPMTRKRTPPTLMVCPMARSGEMPRSSTVEEPRTATGRLWSTSNCVKKVPACTVRWLIVLYVGNVPMTAVMAEVEPVVTVAFVSTV